jgi:hypothetical protein
MLTPGAIEGNWLTGTVPFGREIEGEGRGLSSDRVLRRHRRHADRRPGRDERFDRLVLLPTSTRPACSPPVCAKTAPLPRSRSLTLGSCWSSNPGERTSRSTLPLLPRRAILRRPSAHAEEVVETRQDASASAQGPQRLRADWPRGDSCHPGRVRAILIAVFWAIWRPPDSNLRQCRPFSVETA